MCCLVPLEFCDRDYLLVPELLRPLGRPPRHFQRCLGAGQLGREFSHVDPGEDAAYPHPVALFHVHGQHRSGKLAVDGH